MADVCYANSAPFSTTDSFSVIWKMTRAMKKAGWTYKASGNGTSKDTTAVATNDLWGGSADPSSDTYPSAMATRAAWWCAEGPGTVKVPITAAPTGTFIRGERVTQADGSEGEFQGYVINAAGNSGWAVIRLRSAKSTWTGTGTVTGAVSGATLTPSATPKVYVRQIVIAKDTTATAGSIYYICADQSAESASLFSTLAGSSLCTATVAPGDGNAATPNNTNNFPAIGLVCLGQNTSVLNGAAGTINRVSWFSMATSLGNAQISAMNATPTTGSSGVTADATFWAVLDQTSAQGTYSGIGLFVLDDTEQGDVDPYVFFFPSSTGFTFAYTGRNAAPSTFFSTIWNGSPQNGGSSTSWQWLGYCARGTGGSKDVAAPFNGSLEGSTFWILATTATQQRVANHPDGASAPLLRVPLVLWCDISDRKIRKGVPRWLAFAPLGSSMDTYDTKQWLVVTTLSGTSTPAMLLGKYDGSTTPLP